MGKLRDVPVIVMQGRFHAYEGYELWKVNIFHAYEGYELWKVNRFNGYE